MPQEIPSARLPASARGRPPACLGPRPPPGGRYAPPAPSVFRAPRAPSPEGM